MQQAIPDSMVADALTELQMMCRADRAWQICDTEIAEEQRLSIFGEDGKDASC